MRTIAAYIEDHLILPFEGCPWMPCLSETVCGYYEGLDSSGEAVLCSLDNTGPEA